MEELKMMKQNLMACVQAQMSNLQQADVKELGEAVDMIKDLAEAEYYCSIVKAMEDSDKEKKDMEKMMAKGYYQMPQVHYPPYREPYFYDGGNNTHGNGMRGYDKRYYGNDSQNYYDGNSSRNYNGREYQMYFEGDPTQPIMSSTGMRDYREGRSGMSRRGYMESKEKHLGKEKKMQDLEKYMNELSQDITEMIMGAEPDEKQKLSEKLSHLAEKIK